MRAQVSDVLWQHSRWMTWNALLALIPFALAHTLFHRPRRRTVTWWAGVVAFFLFLPNAPYVLTDVVHLFEDVRQVPSDQAVLFVLVPVYATLFAIGFGAYALSIREVAFWLRSRHVPSYRVGLVVLAIHAVSAIGIDVGRFGRFNSWDVVLRPVALVTGFGQSFEHPLRIAASFVLIVGLYTAARIFMAGARVSVRAVARQGPRAA